MLPLILFVSLGLVILVLFEWRARKQSAQEREKDDKAVEERQRQNVEGECCGQHLVCEKENTMQMPVVYYDDEELDALQGVPAEELTAAQAQAIKDVFYTLKEEDVTGWVRSLSQRGIALPLDIRDEALMIVRENRSHG